MTDPTAGWINSELELLRHKADAAATRATYATANGDYGAAARPRENLRDSSTRSFKLSSRRINGLHNNSRPRNSSNMHSISAHHRSMK
jgi:hypothetical protein